MKLLILTNILTPYRVHFFDCLRECLLNHAGSLHVLVMAESEPNRSWSYAEYQRCYTTLLSGNTISFAGAYLHVVRGLEEKINSFAPDCIVCAGSYLEPSVWGAIQIAKRSDVPVYFWSESHLGENKQRSSLGYLARESIRRAIYPKFNGFWVAGSLSERFVDRYSDSNTPRVFVPNIVYRSIFGAVSYSDQNKMELRRQYDIPLSKRILFSPARLDKVKGLCEFIKLLGSCKRKAECAFVVAGDGPLHDDILRLANEQGVEVILLGYKGQSEMVELYACADFFVMPSLSDPNPLTCVEACWSGLPLIVSEHVGNYPEIVRNEVNGFVFSYNDPAHASEMLDKAISSDDSWIMNASRYSRSVAEEKYDPVSNSSRIVSTMYRLCECE